MVRASTFSIDPFVGPLSFQTREAGITIATLQGTALHL
jgi:hypothetical protein